MEALRLRRRNRLKQALGARALDRGEGRTGHDRETPSTQLLRYLRRIDDLTNGNLRWGILTNGAR